LLQQHETSDYRCSAHRCVLRRCVLRRYLRNFDRAHVPPPFPVFTSCSICSLGRNRAGSSAACKCASYTLAGKPAILEPTNARRAMLQSFVGGSFRERVESSCLSRTVRAHETALDLTMRKTSIGSKKISLSPTKSVMKPFVSEKPSHQVIAYQSCKFSCLNSSNLKRRAKNFSTRCSTGPRAQCLLRTTLNRFGDKASLWRAVLSS
jgi:hypothetical protein